MMEDLAYSDLFDPADIGCWTTSSQQDGPSGFLLAQQRSTSLVHQIVFYLWPIIVLLLSVGGVSADQDAKRLYEDLLTDYNRLIRPVGNNSDRLTVKLGLKLSQLIDVVKSVDLNILVEPFKWISI